MTTTALRSLCATFFISVSAAVSAAKAAEFFDGTSDSAGKEVMRQAEAGIEKYRKGDFTVTVELDGPNPDAREVTIDLIRHQFNFGCSMFGMSRLPDGDPLKKAGLQAILDLFNQVVVVDHWYNPYGDIADKKPAEDIAWAEAHNLRMRYHAILYEEPREAIGKHLTTEQFWQLFDERFRYVASIPGLKTQTCDVINEVLSRKYWYKNNPTSFYRLEPTYPDLSQPDLIVRAFALARKYLPDAKLTALENGNANTSDKSYREIVAMWKAALEAGADIDYIGTQCHFFDDGQSFRPEERTKQKDNYTMAEISKALDMQEALGKPIEVTEFTGPSRNKLKSAEFNQKIWTMSEAENSAWQINFYKLVFSKPYIIGLTRWNLIDQYCGRSMDGGILTQTGDKHQIYYDLRKLIKEEWHTRVTQPLSASAVSFRGFYGDYQVIVEGYESVTITLTPENKNAKVVLKKKQPAQAAPAEIPAQREIAAAMRRAFDWQIANRTTTKFPADSNQGPRGWVHGAFMTGVLEAARTTDDSAYLDYAWKIATDNSWQIGPRFEHGDDHIIGQTYLELHGIDPARANIKPTLDTFDRLLAKHYDGATLLWWCDSLYMHPQVWARLAKATGDKKYLDEMDRLYWACVDFLYDKDEHLFYRDKRYMPHDKDFKPAVPNKKGVVENFIEANGKKMFWSRGNGWVFAGLPRIMNYIPKDDPRRAKYENLFREMAARIAALQSPDGLWRMGLLDPGAYSHGEESGSAFFVYGLAWGVRTGLLDAETYRPVIERGWRALLACQQPDGMVGYVQPIGAAPGDFSGKTSQEYGTGGFLLAGSEMYKLSAP